jgi:hypothetical protein
MLIDLSDCTMPAELRDYLDGDSAADADAPTVWAVARNGDMGRGMRVASSVHAEPEDEDGGAYDRYLQLAASIRAAARQR